MEEKYSQLLDEEDASDVSEKSKAGGTSTPEKKTTLNQDVKKESSVLPEQQPSVPAVPSPANPVKLEKEELEHDSEQDDPTGSNKVSFD